MDVSSQSASIEQKPVNHRESAEHESNPQAASGTRSCEDVFGENPRAVGLSGGSGCAYYW